MRVTEARVRTMMGTTLSNAQIEPHLRSASVLVDEACSSAYGDDILAEIELNLACHFIATTRDPLRESETIGPTAATYQGKTGMGLDGSTYGQRVATLDYKRLLGKKIGADLRWLGKVDT